MALLPTGAVFTEGKGLPMGDEVAVTSTMACPCVRGVEVSSAVDVSVLLPSLSSMVPEAGEVLEVEATGLGVVGPCVMVASAVTAEPAVEDREENPTAVGGWDVVAKSVSVVPLVLLCWGLGVTAEEPSGEEEEEEWLITAELRGREEAVPLSVPMLRAVVPGPAVGSAGLTAPLPGDVLSELPSHAGVVSVVSVLPSSLTVLIVEGDTRDVAGREWEVWTLGSIVVPLP